MLLSPGGHGFWAFLLVWVVRIVTLSFIFRMYAGPALLKLVSKRLRVRSVSLRSIRGIYFRAGSGTIRIDRVGISYHRPSPTTASRLTLLVEGLKLRPSLKRRRSSPASRFGDRVRLATFAALRSTWNFLDPYVRPFIRTSIVSVLRFVILIDFELDSAVATYAALPGVELVLKQAKVKTKVSLSIVDNVVIPGASAAPNPNHWNARVQNSLRRTWDRAWGATQVTASLSLRLKGISATASPLALKDMPTALHASTRCFIYLPGTKFKASVRIDPHRAVESHSVETTLLVDSLDVHTDVIQYLLKRLSAGKKAKTNGTATGNENSSSSPVNPLPPGFGPPSPLLSPWSPVRSPLSPSHRVSFSALSPPDPRPLSPRASTFSPNESSPLSPSPATTRKPMWSSPMSPGSPLMEAFLPYASLKLGWGAKPIPVRRLNSRNSRLAFLKGIDITVSKLTMKHSLPRIETGVAQTFEMALHDFHVGAGLSHPDTTPLHRQHLGSRSVPNDPLSSDVYRLTVSAHQVTLDRFGSGALVDHLRLLSISSIFAGAVVSQWPTPWLKGPAFMSGDPNSQLLAIDVELGTVEVTERLEVLHAMMAKTKPPKPKTEARSPLPTVLSPVPRIAFGFKVGPVVARLISLSPGNDETPFALEARTDGLAISLHSQYVSLPDKRLAHVSHDRIGLQMDVLLACQLQRTFVGRWEQPRESLLSIDTIQVTASGNALGDVADEVHNTVTVDVPSAYTDLQCSTEAISVELWQPDVIKALSSILASFAGTPNPPSPSPRSRALEQLPFGLSASVAVGRFVLFVTAPDIAPTEDLGISRGIAVHLGACFSYCAVHSRHAERIHGIRPRSQTRLRLSLPTEHVMKAVAGSSPPVATRSTRALVGVNLWDMVVRDAVATKFSADDPYCLAELDAELGTREFLRIRSIDVEGILTGVRPNGAFQPVHKDELVITATASLIRGTLRLAQLYNVLLAVKTLQSIAPSRPKSSQPSSTTSVLVTLQCDIKQMQLLLLLPVQTKLYLRASYLCCDVTSQSTVAIKWSSIVLAVNASTEWEEFACLADWRVSLPLKTRPLVVNVEADGARLRIPFDYVLADLILDINLTIKSAKHLVRMVAAGKYHRPTAPEAESAKVLPKMIAADEEFESRLGLIWRAGFPAAGLRRERDEAFEAKVSTISASQSTHALPRTREAESDFQFSAKHTVSVADARQRLFQVHSVAWRSAYSKSRSTQAAHEQHRLRHALGDHANAKDVDDLVQVNPTNNLPPLFRLTFDSLALNLESPACLIENVSDFLHDAGSGLPKDTRFSLLVPLHISFTVSSARLSLREYPLPMLNIPASSTSSPALAFDSDVVIAEEMGSERSVDWIKSVVVKENYGVHGASPLSISVPKTIMPVKSYARPTIRVLTNDVTDFAWGVSYGAATQDLMRDRSPPIGFWDKLRLIFHWRVKVTFENEVHLHMKGSRDPYELTGTGSGFALCWRGSPSILIGQPNEQGELMQVKSDSMLIVIPNVQDKWGAQPTSVSSATFSTSNPKRLREAKPFDRKCRMFTFRPHYDVKLETKAVIPEIKSAADSYNGFRSDFIHMSISLESALHVREHSGPQASSLHLSPEVFEQFWAWYQLFDHALSLPIRQGSHYPRKRPVSPKFGQHLATLKYRFAISQLFLSHVYVDNSRDAWADGVTPFVGVKALIDRFQADMHQRDQESTRMTDEGPQVVHHKSFYAIEVAMKQLDLRTMLAVFPEPLKQQVQMDLSPLVSDYRTKIKTEPIPADSPWIDLDDFDDAQSSTATPDVHLLRAAFCPQFTYFKRPVDPGLVPQGKVVERSKFGNEETHVCYLGKEASVTQTQLALTGARIKELQEKLIHKAGRTMDNGFLSVPQAKAPHAADMTGDDADDLRKKINLLNKYVAHLHRADVTSNPHASHGIHSYQMPSEAVSADDWAEFDNVYQIHSPQIFLDHIIRDVMMQYYYCSRAKRGIEYHMATRAVKFIRDQARTVLVDTPQEKEQHRGPVASAQAAALAVRNFLVGDHASSHAGEDSQYPSLDTPGPMDPLGGWSDGVSLRKSHFCLLLKPQIVLRSGNDTDTGPDSVCILAALQGKLSSFAILDDANADDPVSGKVMSRNFASVSGLQVFSPSAANTSGEGSVPLEVLIDLRCENKAFDRLVPQTDASFQYDKFNRLRLRNDITSIAHTTEDRDRQHDHLHNQTDLIRVHVPRFIVSANDRHFQAISNIVTNLVLFSNAASKDRSDKLEKMVFSYDFTNLGSAADVVADMQARLRHAFETRREAVRKLRGAGDQGQVEIYKIDAHIMLLAEELNLTFDAIKMAQDKSTEHSNRNRREQLLAKLAVRDIHFYWLSRQDSSLVNNLVVGDLQAFDGAADAEWTEILSKYEEASTHPLVKRKLFLLADWIVLPAVGGITIYERFEVTLHPMRLQIDTRIGRRIMEYVWPARRERQQAKDEIQTFDTLMESPITEEPVDIIIVPESPMSPRRSSWDVSPRTREDPHKAATSPLRKLGASRSFTDLRKARTDSLRPPTPTLHKTRSTEGLSHEAHPMRQVSKSGSDAKDRTLPLRKGKDVDDATEMKTRSSQKTFVWVRVNSLHFLLSIAKEDSFLCRDARIRTRDLEYRNQTSSFEELVDQFIPSGRNWRGWVKMAFQQPLPRRSGSSPHPTATPRSRAPSLPSSTSSLNPFHSRHSGTGSSPSTTASSSTVPSAPATPPVAPRAARRRTRSLFSLHRNRVSSPPPVPSVPPMPIVTPELSSEPESLQEQTDASAEKRTRRPRVLSVFKRRQHSAGVVRGSMESDMSNASLSSRPSGHSRVESTTTDESFT
ncbi:golgi-body localization protein domain-containing protein [Fomitopsis serialis]|uniref:golgi-body localization protein domain-containing protein n=1 Tax=Fomitopsis serialis TaxID=139415 RepID=UPI0020073D28|nr:golgi-body localization protein domain-containing protein [Neoantrodia serialis]KAH9938206.1 golgi-body localization protein domain-containing protein [Neoantrodia serialis]